MSQNKRLVSFVKCSQRAAWYYSLFEHERGKWRQCPEAGHDTLSLSLSRFLALSLSLAFSLPLYISLFRSLSFSLSLALARSLALCLSLALPRSLALPLSLSLTLARSRPLSRQECETLEGKIQDAGAEIRKLTERKQVLYPTPYTFHTT